MEPSRSVCIVILNYGTPALTIQCAKSLHASLAHYPNACIVIVDNGSGDDSLVRLRAMLTGGEWGGRAELLPLPTNAGYAAGNNAAIRQVLHAPNPPEYVWLLNPDTRVREGALEVLVAFMEKNPRAGIAGSRLEDADGTPQRSAFRFPSIAGEWELSLRWGWMTRALQRWVTAPPVPITTARTDWVPGASMLIRRAVLEQVGLLDENFFMYYEDVDFCRRARNKGWETWYVPRGRVEHWGGETSGVTPARRVRSRKPPFWFDARRYYFIKHHGRRYALGADSVWLLGFAIWRVRQVIQHKPESDAPRLWRDFLAHSLWRVKVSETERRPE